MTNGSVSSRPMTMELICREFDNLNITYEWIKDRPSLVRAFINGKWRYMRGCLTELSSPLGVSISDDKPTSMLLAEKLGLAVPEWVSTHTDSVPHGFFRKYDSVVVKPIAGAHGNSVAIGVRTKNELKKALQVAREMSGNDDIRCLIQRQVFGRDVRVLVIGGRAVAATERIPAGVIGDGQRSLLELIKLENKNNPLRAEGYSAPLNVIDEVAANRFLGEKIHEIPASGQRAQVVGASNIGLGGTSRDVTYLLPEEIKRRAELIADEVSLSVCGVDFMAEDIENVANYYFIEMNACPSFGLQVYPTEGDSQPVAKKFVDYIIANMR